MTPQQAIAARQMIEAIDFLINVAASKKMAVVVARLLDVRVALETIAVANDEPSSGSGLASNNGGGKRPGGAIARRKPDAA